MQLTNIQKNIITNLETFSLNSIIGDSDIGSYLSTNNSYLTWYKKYNGKYQMAMATHHHVHVVYYSPKYERYNYVAVLPLYELPQAHKRSNKVYNPEWLDKYYDTIFTYNQCVLNSQFSAITDDDYWHFYGDELLDLVSIPKLREQDSERDYIDHRVQGLYYKDSFSTSTSQYTLDDPNEINRGKGPVEEVDGIYEFTYDQLYKNFYLGTYNLYLGMNKIYNYVESSSADIVTINDEYSFILDLVTDQELTDPLVLVHNGTVLALKPKETIDIEAVLGSELFNNINIMVGVIKGTGHASIPELKPSLDGTAIEKDFNYAEYLFFDDVLDGMNSFALRAVTLGKQYDNINAIVQPIAFDENGLCRFKLDGNLIVFRKSDTFDNTNFIVPEKQVAKRFEYLFETYIGERDEDDQIDPTVKQYHSIAIKMESEDNHISFGIAPFHLDSTNMVEFELDERQHVEFIGYQPTFGHSAPYTEFINFSDATVADRLELMDNDIKIKNFKVNEFLFNNNIIDDPDRFIISGITIDVDNSKATALSDLINASFRYNHGGNLSEVVTLLMRYTKTNEIIVDEYPLPLLSNNMVNFFNVNTPNTSDTIHNETIYTEAYINEMYRTGFNFIDVRNDINALVDDTAATLGSYDRSIYNLYCKSYGNFDFLQIRNQENFFIVFMITDKYTGKRDFMQIDLLGEVKPVVPTSWLSQTIFNDKIAVMPRHVKANFQYETQKQINGFFTNYEGNPYNETTSFKSKVIATNKYNTTLPVWLTKLTIKRGNYINGSLERVIFKNAKALDTDNTTFVTIDATVDAADFTIDSHDLVFDLSGVFGTYRVMEYCEIELQYSKMYRAFDYVDKFALLLDFNIRNFSVIQNYGIRASFVPLAHNNVRQTRMNVRPPKHIECLPQEVYNESITASVFDIDDYVWDYVTDDKQCILLNNFVGNNFNDDFSASVFDSTSFDTSDIAVIDRFVTPYVKYAQQWKSLPFLTDNSTIGQYVRVYVDASLPADATNIFEQFEYYNLYNPSLVTADGVLMMDGKISDYEDGMEFTDMLKLYRTELIWTIWHNVVNTLQQPLNFNLKVKTYADKASFDSDTDATSLPDINDFFYIKIFNRGDHIKQKHEWYPRVLQHIEFFEINPEYDWQEKKDYIYTIEYNLFSDHPDIKVSELFFDVLFKTDDAKIGIPVDYTSLEDPLHAVDFNWSDDTEEILYYFNWLIRNTCPNCTDAHFSIKVKIEPEMFGFNIANFTIGAYMHNVKLEERIPYIYYKESADALMILDKKTDMDTDRIVLPTNIREDLWSKTHGASPFNLGDPEHADITDFCGTVNVPKNTKAHWLFFNSSFYPKRIKFTLESNTSMKTIHSQVKEVAFPPFDFRIVTFEETVEQADYTGGFGGGLATYKVEEISEHLDTTTELPNEKLQLVIPSYDEAMSRIMSFMDKSSKLVKLRYKKNDNIEDIREPKEKVVIANALGVSVIEIRNDITEWEKYGQLLDIDRRFYIEKKYIVKMDMDSLQHFSPFFEAFDPQIQLKIPISKPKVKIYANVGGVDLNKDDYRNPINHAFRDILSDSTGINEDFNNYYDLENDYLYLIGERTDIDEFIFTLSGFIYYQNSDLLQALTQEYYDEGIFKFGFHARKRLLRPRFILELLFGVYGTDLIQYMIDTFVLAPEGSMENYDRFVAEFVTHVGDRQGMTVTEEQAKQPIFDDGYTFKSMSTLDRNAAMDVLKSETIEEWLTSPTAVVGLRDDEYKYNMMQGSPVQPGFGKGINFAKEVQLLSEFFFTDHDEEDSEDLAKSVTGNRWVHPDEMESGWEGQTFDSLYDIMNNTGLSRMFAAESYFVGNTQLSRSNTIAPPVKYKVTLDADGGTDVINSVYFGSGVTEVGYIDPKGDTIKLLQPSMPLTVEFNSMRWYKLNLKMNDKRLRITNTVYPVFQAFQEKILSDPLKILTFTKKYTIIQDSNFKKWFSIPIEIFKGADAYLTIDKIKVVDNYINPNSFNVSFGTHNERFTLDGNGELILNKIMNKFEHGLRIMFDVLGIANTTGAYNTTLLIYYTINGTQYVEEKDIIYDVVLPEVLDNEYLIMTIDRLDYTPPTFKLRKKTPSGRYKVVEAFSTETVFDSYYNVNLGTPGCKLSYPDYNWHDTVEENDTLNQFTDRPTGDGLTANLDDYKDL